MKIIEDIFNSSIFGIRWGNLILDDYYDEACMTEQSSNFDLVSAKIGVDDIALLNKMLKDGFLLVDTLSVFRKMDNIFENVDTVIRGGNAI